MAYKIMYYEDYETEDGARASIPVEYDGIEYESRIAAWRAYWKKEDISPEKVGYNVFVKEI